MKVFLPVILQTFKQFVNDSSAASALIQKQLLKILYALVQVTDRSLAVCLLNNAISEILTKLTDSFGGNLPFTLPLTSIIKMWLDGTTGILCEKNESF